MKAERDRVWETGKNYAHLRVCPHVSHLVTQPFWCAHGPCKTVIGLEEFTWWYLLYTLSPCCILSHLSPYVIPEGVKSSAALRPWLKQPRFPGPWHRSSSSVLVASPSSSALTADMALDSPLDTSCTTQRTSLPLQGLWHWVSHAALMFSFRDSLMLRESVWNIRRVFSLSFKSLTWPVLHAGKPDIVGQYHLTAPLDYCAVCLFSACCLLSETPRIVVFSQCLTSSCKWAFQGL